MSPPISSVPMMWMVRVGRDVAPNMSCEAAAVGELDDDRLVVDHVVIAVPDAAAERVVGAQRLELLFLGGVAAAQVLDRSRRRTTRPCVMQLARAE